MQSLQQMEAGRMEAGRDERTDGSREADMGDEGEQAGGKAGAWDGGRWSLALYVQRKGLSKRSRRCEGQIMYKVICRITYFFVLVCNIAIFQHISLSFLGSMHM